MNMSCKYCDVDGVCTLENIICMGLPNDMCNVEMQVPRKGNSNAYEEYVVYFYTGEGKYVYCIRCWCSEVDELLDLIDDECNDYLYEIRKVENET